MIRKAGAGEAWSSCERPVQKRHRFGVLLIKKLRDYGVVF